MAPKFFTQNDKYTVLTGESPKEFKDYLFVAITGNSPTELKEALISRDDVQKMTEIEGYEVPDDWAEAFEKAGIVVPRPDEFEPEPVKTVELDVEFVPSENDKFMAYGILWMIGTGIMYLLFVWSNVFYPGKE